MTNSGQEKALSSDSFTCDYGFQWQRGKSGSHNCGPYYRETIAKLNAQLSASPQLPVAEQLAGQAVSDAEIVEWSKQFGHYEESRWGADMNPVPQFHSSEISIVRMVRALLAQPAPANAEGAPFRNLISAERTSDQSVELVFMSCRAASEFHDAALAAKEQA